MNCRRASDASLSTFWSFGVEATFGQESNGSYIGGEKLRAGFALHWFNEDSVAVVVVDDLHVGVAGTAGGVGVDLTTDWLKIGEETMGRSAVGNDAISAPSAVRTGYAIIEQTCLFASSCRDWRNKLEADKTVSSSKSTSVEPTSIAASP
jgi:hypothetical protein